MKKIKTNSKVQFSWEGKEQAIRECETPPAQVYDIPSDIKGNEIHCVDNLDFLKLNQERLKGKVKCIYIDPPYNTGKDFIYKDKRHKGKECKHSKWLSFMFPRLVLARELLREDGVIFISIDDNEQANLRLLMNEIFGEGEFVGHFTRITKTSSNNGTHFSPCTDYVISYAKDINKLNTFRVDLTPEQLASYNKQDDKGKYKEIGLYQAALKHGGSRYPITTPDSEQVITPNNLPWRWNEKRFMQGLENDEIVFKKTQKSPLINFQTEKRSEWNIYTKLYLHNREDDGLLPKNFSDSFQNTLGTNDLKALDIIFDFPKPVALIKHLLQISTQEGDLVLDFFAGSGTTAQAVMELNFEETQKAEKDGLLSDGKPAGGRKFILVQLPEKIKEEEEAFKAGYRVISDITMERVRRAGEKYKGVDVGFKVFK